MIDSNFHVISLIHSRTYWCKTSATCNNTNLLPNSHIEQGYCPTVWANGLSDPRQITVASNGDVIVLEAGINSITGLNN
jgi:hypothetical protein